MTERGEAKPKQRRRRRSTFPKRVELRMTESQFDLVVSRAAEATERLGRTVTFSDIIRDAVEDGCRRLGRSLQRSTTSVGDRLAGLLSPAAADRLLDELQQVRGEVRRIGHNVNQMAKVAHASGQVPDELATVKDELAALDASLVVLATRVAGVDREG